MLGGDEGETRGKHPSEITVNRHRNYDQKWSKLRLKGTRITGDVERQLESDNEKSK